MNSEAPTSWAALSTLPPTSWLQRLVWPQGLSTGSSASWLTPSQCLWLWGALVGFAALDVAYPIPLLCQSWFCVFFILWSVPGRQYALGDSVVREAIGSAFLLGFFSWLIFRTQTAVRDSFSTWTVFDGIHWWELLTYPLQHTLAVIVTASLIVVPLARVFGQRSIAAAIVAPLPYCLICVPHTVFSASHWTGHTAATAIGLYDVLIVPLVMAEAVSMVERLGLRTETQPRLANVRRYLAAALRGRLNVLIALILFCVAALAAVASGSWAYRLGGDHLHESPFVAAARAIVFPVLLYLAALTWIACWRSLARAGRRHVVLDNLATFGTRRPFCGRLRAHSVRRLSYPLSWEAAQWRPSRTWAEAPGPSRFARRTPFDLAAS